MNIDSKVISHLRFSLVTGTLASLIITLVFTVWNWLENPSEIFHDESGTHWNFVLDTALSWLLPSFVYVVGGSIVGGILWYLPVQLHRRSHQK